MQPAPVLCGIGTSLPDRVVTNDDLAARLDTSDEWIRTRTGIRERRTVDPGTATGDLAHAAAQGALKSAGSAAVDLVILATTTPDHPCPATAPHVAQRLGLTGVPAWDLAAVCSGFVYALACASSFVRSGSAARVLVIGADTYSTITDPDDRSTRAIFGDGAGAVVVRAGTADEDGAIGPVTLGSDGSLKDAILVDAGGSRRPLPDGLAQDGRYFTMQGKTVFRHAVERMSQSAEKVRTEAGWSTGDVDCLVAHQANARIIDAVAAQMGLAPEQCALSIERLGNTAAASIPLAMAEAARSGQLRAGSRVLLTAFGGGATWGAAALTWPDVTPVSI
ncbi:3-oxoacyl-[acyl-carrier-protein] synthase 3 protein 5 [Streptomyces viridiviolaceus]|uniref:Beta-ketoacyl-[acyl-carrier-protein] synthase III n=1 Tax=Streptomyces viridiviolaceus TaxID=68282 RepID=A0ABW2E6P7_9ACTN|nr:beta-ketoacyl-ACP synthase III [Streptomyces viridiviolaceus]GHB57161.1 3-oxoacyl-[acyl-carrier-protein] synthase 3 protein 5 [Streptomyces viridiviolaceus]